jgi:hypothetical protein
VFKILHVDFRYMFISECAEDDEWLRVNPDSLLLPAVIN